MVRKKYPWLFFVLIYTFSAPFWLLATRFEHSDLPDNLPITDVGAVLTPTISAAVLRYRESGWAGVRELLTRAFDFQRITRRVWLLVSALLPVTLCIVTYIAVRWLNLSVASTWSLPLKLVAVFPFFFVGAVAEELGYTAYATDVLQKRMTALAAAVTIGTIWAIWHLPSMIRVGQSPALILWGLCATVAFRVLWVWIYNNADRSVCAVILAHATYNSSRTSFPGGRGAYELDNGSVAYSIIIGVTLLVIALWGPRKLTTFP